jgi:hypothetical protein
MIMFVKRLAFVLLIVAVLCSLVGTAVAQSEPQQFVVVYVEFKPANARTEGDVLQQQHTVDFRTATAPFLGAPYDERLYQFVSR